MASPLYLAVVVTLFVGSGTLVSIVMKVTFETEVRGNDDEVKKFKKPWAAMFVMCLAMTSVLLKYAYDKKRANAREATFPTRLVACKVALPAFLQLLGTFLQALGLTWISVSVYQMLQSSVVIFSALIRFLWMGKGLARFETCGVILTAVGLSCVGAASIVGGSDKASATPMTLQIVGIALVLASQAIIALEAVIEERLLQGFAVPPEFICGMVGSWGLLYSILIFIPLAQVFPGEEGKGLREDSIETLHMISSSTTLQVLLLAFFCVILLYNQTMRMLICATQATTMQVLGGLRTLCVWVAALLIYFQWPKYGEQWTMSSWIELCGFLILTAGILIYRATVKLPCFEYPAAATESTAKENLTSMSEN